MKVPKDDTRVFNPEQIHELQGASSLEQIRRIQQKLSISPDNSWIIPNEISAVAETLVSVEILAPVETPKTVQSTKTEVTKNIVRIFQSTPDISDIEVCKQAFKNHQWIAFTVLNEHFLSDLTHGQYERYNISNIFRDLLEAYKTIWHVSMVLSENYTDEDEAIRYCLSDKIHPTYENKLNWALIRGYKKDSLSFREVAIDMNVIICNWLIQDLDKLIWDLTGKHGITGYYEVWKHGTYSDPTKNIVSVRFFFYSKWNTTDIQRKEEDKILRMIGIIADRFKRGTIPFWDIINNSESAWAYLTPQEFSQKEESQFFQLIKDVWNVPLLGVIKAFLTTEETTVQDGLIGSRFITKLDRKSFYYIKKVFEDFGIDITYKKDKWFVFHPIS